MVTVAEVTPLRVGVRIRLDNDRVVFLTRKEAAEGGFTEGMQIDENEFDQFVRLRQYPRALNQAVAMLARRPCSRREIERRLQETRYEQEIVELVLYKLEKEKLINDADFAEAWVHYRSGGRYGERRIRQELKQKGVSEEIMQQAMEDLDESEMLDNAAHLASRFLARSKPGEPPAKARNRVMAALIRKGYSWDTAAKAYQIAAGQKD